MSNILDKIQKLLALANDHRGNESERDNALSMASALMLKHGIQEKDLMSRNDNDRIGRGQYDMWYGRHYQFTLMQAVSHLYSIRFVYRKKDFAFVGKPEYIQASELTFHFLLGQVEMLYKAALPRGMTQKDRAKFRRHFKEACSQRIQERVWHIVYSFQTERGAAALGTNALVVVDHRRQQLMEINDYLSGIEEGNNKKTRPKNTMAEHAGRVAGDHVQINEAVKR